MHPLLVPAAGKLVICLLTTLLLTGCDKHDRDQKSPTSILPLGATVLEKSKHVGEVIPDLSFTDIHGKASRLSELSGNNMLVITMRDTQCPVSRKYAPLLARMESEYVRLGVSFLFVNPGQTDSAEAWRKDIEQNGFRGFYVADTDQQITTALGATSSGEVFVLDANRTLRYRGAIDDQHGIGYSKKSATRFYLDDALQAVLAKQTVTIPVTSAPGCLISQRGIQDGSEKITWHNQVSRIVQRHCQDCHRPGASAPFSLLTYRDVAGRKDMIRYVVEQGIMPPWFAAENTGPWRNTRRLPADVRDQLLSWIDQGAPAGDPEQSPPARRWAAEWRIGHPDAVIQLPEKISIQAEGTMPYLYKSVATSFDEDKWIRGLEIRSDTPWLVHHILAFVLPEGQQHWSKQAALNGFLHVKGPGSDPIVYPDGFARRLPKRASIMFQIHYQPNGAAMEDQPRLGLLFTDKPPAHEIRTSAASNFKFLIPPGDPDFTVVAKHRIKQRVYLTGFYPHMHLRGKSFRYELLTPDRQRHNLLYLPRFDFNWQYSYYLETPVEVPANSLLIATAHYDNSADNPINPDPAQAVGFGFQVEDEMLLGCFNWYQ